MKAHKLLTIIGSICVLLGTQACANMGGSAESSAATSEATAEIDKAKAMGNEWRDSRKLLDKAKKAEADGDSEAADKLIAKAKQQGVNAQMQAKAQMDVDGPH